MSRIGRQVIEIPKGVKAQINGATFNVEGPKGKLSRQMRPEITVVQEDNKLLLHRKDDSANSRAFHGMERALLNNMVTGVSSGFSKELQLIGVGYRADMKGKNINLGLGYSHDIEFPVPQGINASVIKEGREIFVRLEGLDKQLIGQTAAQIRSLRPPEPYKGKGVRYRNEKVKTKAGKAGKK